MLACAPAVPSPETGVTPAPAPSPSPVPRPAPTLRWFGHATFLLTSSQGTRLLMDPMPGDFGYGVSPMPADVVTMGHEHFDHNNAGLAQGNPTILRGLVGNDWNKIDQRIGDVRIYTVPTYHDAVEGRQRGKNSVFILEVDGLRVVHLSDLGHVLTPEQVRAMGEVDVLLIPVGGFFTIDAAAAAQVVEQLRPRIAVPMHYKTPKTPGNLPIVGAEEFLKDKRVERPGSTTLTLHKDRLPAATTVVVLNYE